MTKSTASEIENALAAIPLWTREEAVITRVFRFADFASAMRFVNEVAAKAESAGHHPAIDIRWNKVRLSLTTHDAGGLTAADFALAGVLDSITG